MAPPDSECYRAGMKQSCMYVNRCSSDNIELRITGQVAQLREGDYVGYVTVSEARHLAEKLLELTDPDWSPRPPAEIIEFPRAIR
jgi:hypothetical protein